LRKAPSIESGEDWDRGLDSHVAFKVVPAFRELERYRRSILLRQALATLAGLTLLGWLLYRLDHPAGEPLWQHLLAGGTVIILLIYAFDRFAVYGNHLDNRLAELSSSFFRESRYVQEVIPRLTVEFWLIVAIKTSFRAIFPYFPIPIPVTKKLWRMSKWRPDFGIVGANGDACYSFIDFHIPNYSGCALSVHHPALADIEAFVAPECPEDYMPPANFPPENRSLFFELAQKQAYRMDAYAIRPTPIMHYDPDTGWTVGEHEFLKDWQFDREFTALEGSCWHLFRPRGAAPLNEEQERIIRDFSQHLKRQREPVLLVHQGELTLVNSSFIGQAGNGLLKSADSNFPAFRQWIVSLAAPLRAVAKIEGRYDGPVN
jgi:hypothetical protein